MPSRNEEKYHIVVNGEPQKVTEVRDKILNTFNELVFVDEGHKYFLGDKELISVSVFAQQFEETFDTLAKATAYAAKNGQTPEYWMDVWRLTNLKATTKGTQIHAYAEGLSWLNIGHPENIPEDQKYKYVADKGWLVPTRPQEEAAFTFWNEFPSTWHVVLPETRVYTGAQYRKGYAGTFDLLVYDEEKDGLLVLDWKTNADIYKEYSRSRNKMMYYPFNNLYMEPLGVYNIQLNAYAVCLEDIGLNVIGKRIIWLKEDGTYDIVEVGNEENKIREIIT